MDITKKKSKRRVFYEVAVSPIKIEQGNHQQIKVARPRSRGRALGHVTPQQ